MRSYVGRTLLKWRGVDTLIDHLHIWSINTIIQGMQFQQGTCHWASIINLMKQHHFLKGTNRLLIIIWKEEFHFRYIPNQFLIFNLFSYIQATNHILTMPFYHNNLVTVHKNTKVTIEKNTNSNIIINPIIINRIIINPNINTNNNIKLIFQVRILISAIVFTKITIILINLIKILTELTIMILSEKIHISCIHLDQITLKRII